MTVAPGEDSVLAHNCKVGYTKQYAENFDKAFGNTSKHALNFSSELSLPGDVARARLRNALGLLRGDLDEGHHLIPLELVNHPLVQQAARVGFNFNGAITGLPLSFSRHRGVNVFHHNKYNAAVRRKLNRILDMNPAVSDARAAELLSNYANQLRNGISRTKGRLR